MDIFSCSSCPTHRSQISTPIPATMPGRKTSKPDIEESRFDYHDDIGATLQEARTTGAVSISADLFEKLYLAPKTDVSGQLRRTFGNPTPMYVALAAGYKAPPLPKWCSRTCG